MSAADDPDALLTIDTVAALYGYQVSTIRKKIRKKEVPEPKKLGPRTLRWPAHVIRADLKAKGLA